MKNFLTKNYYLIFIMKCILIIISISNVYTFHTSGVQLFNSNFVKHSERYLTGIHIISFMSLHILIEGISIINMFSYYSKKYRWIHYLLGVLSIGISIPLFYNFVDDFIYHSGLVNPLRFILPLFYFFLGILDLVIAGKSTVE